MNRQFSSNGEIVEFLAVHGISIPPRTSHKNNHRNAEDSWWHICRNPSDALSSSHKLARRFGIRPQTIVSQQYTFVSHFRDMNPDDIPRWQDVSHLSSPNATGRRLPVFDCGNRAKSNYAGTQAAWEHLVFHRGKGLSIPKLSEMVGVSPATISKQRRVFRRYFQHLAPALVPAWEHVSYLGKP